MGSYSILNKSDRVIGLLLGLAVGDFHGGPVRMAVRLAESLIERKAFDPKDVLTRYIEWYNDGAFDTGHVSDRVLALIISGTAPEQAVKIAHAELNGMTAGCNPALRCGAISMARFIDDNALPTVAAREASLTHYDPLAGDVSAAMVVLCRNLIIGSDWSGALEFAAVGRTQLTQRALRVLRRDEIDQSGFAPHVLAAAVYFLDKHDSLKGAMDEAFDFAGGSNYCPILVGAIGGARWGAHQVLVDRIRHKDLLPRIFSAAENLASAWRY